MAWTSDQLARIAEAEVLQVSRYRSDGALRRWTPINAQVGAAYESKYRSRPGSLRPMIAPTAAETTVRLDAAD